MSYEKYKNSIIQNINYLNEYALNPDEAPDDLTSEKINDAGMLTLELHSIISKLKNNHLSESDLKIISKDVVDLRERADVLVYGSLLGKSTIFGR